MDISQDDINRAVQQAISKGVRKIIATVDTQAKSCAVRAANQLRNAATSGTDRNASYELGYES